MADERLFFFFVRPDKPTIINVVSLWHLIRGGFFRCTIYVPIKYKIKSY